MLKQFKTGVQIGLGFISVLILSGISYAAFTWVVENDVITGDTLTVDSWNNILNNQKYLKQEIESISFTDTNTQLTEAQVDTFVANNGFLTSLSKAADSNLLDGLDSLAFQKRVGSTCAAGSSIRAINADGTVICETDDGSTGMGDAGHSFAANGYQKFSNGLILQWGSISSTNNVAQTVYFPIAFPTAVLHVSSQPFINNHNNNVSNVYTYNKAYFQHMPYYRVSPSVTKWYAVGY